MHGARMGGEVIRGLSVSVAVEEGSREGDAVDASGTTSGGLSRVLRLVVGDLSFGCGDIHFNFRHFRWHSFLLFPFFKFIYPQLPLLVSRHLPTTAL